MKKEEIIKLRAFAIILVVLGHSIIIFDKSWGLFTTDNENQIFYYLKQFINIIQMPIFFIISGYLFYHTMRKEKYKNIISLIKDKFQRLMIPFLSIAVFWIVPIRLFVKYKPFIEVGYMGSIYKVLTGIDSGHLWFITTLFIIFIIMYMICKIAKKTNYNKIVSIILVIMLLAINIFSYKIKSIFFMQTIAIYLIYFYIGFLASKHDIKSDITINTIYSFISFIITCVVIVFLQKNIIINNTINIICAIFATYSLYCFTNKVKLTKLIEQIDKNSFAIYLLHSPLLYIIYDNFANINPYLLVMFNFIVGITIPLIIAYILRKMKLKILIGE